MKILFISTINPKHQGDYLELTAIHGLRKLLSNNFIEYPKKKIVYGDFSDSPKKTLHGKGFSLLREKIEDVDRSNIFDTKFDAVIYGTGHSIGEDVYLDKFDQLADNNSWVLDGHDLYGKAKIKRKYKKEEVISNQFSYSFKRELIFEEDNVFPTGYGIPKEIIMPIDLSNKKQLIQKTYPNFSKFEVIKDLGGGSEHHIFDNEKDYYEDLHSSWFGLTCKKGGWDSLRHYEILAAGSLLLFRDYSDKPKLCSPQEIPCFSYKSKDELDYLLSNLVIKNKPTNDYIKMLKDQRKWLLNNGTTIARAKNILKVIKSKKKT